MKIIICIIHMVIIIPRVDDFELWKKTGRCVLVYGKRKTGKSLFIRNFTS
jgi:alpha-D-ribose 1-methylphosphonate 5-triphosphate synthase subunit PhnL